MVTSKSKIFQRSFPLAVTSELGLARVDVPFLSSKWKFLMELRNGRPILEAQQFQWRWYGGLSSKDSSCMLF